jgi:NAD(P)-dependent dehydrogenase (short-subunit alcohol dehydrogenase family)
MMSTITLISGANQGIGLAAAKILAKEHGHQVIVGSRNLDAGLKVAKEIEADGGKASSIQLDITSDESIAAATTHIKHKYGHLDVLVNNAGILIDGKVPGMSTRELFTQTLNVNVIGTALLTEALLPLLRQSVLPRIIFVSSLMGSLHQATVQESPFYAIDFKAYDASKAAVNMLALNYARILEDVGGLSNAVCPGLVATSLTGYTVSHF